MWEIMTGIIGLLGVLVGALLVSLLERRNWQRQEAMKAYAELFTVGDDTLRLCNTVTNSVENLNGKLGQSGVGSVVKTDPSIKEEYDQTMSINGEFRNADRRFRHQLTQCWMLERDPDIRAAIRTFEGQYQSAKVGLELRLSRLRDSRKESFAQEIQNSPSPDSMFEELKALQKLIAERHFHGEDSGGAAGEQS